MRRLALAAAAALATALTVLPAAPAAAEDATLTIDVSGPRQVDQQLTVSGMLTSGGQPVAGAMINGSRQDPDGQVQPFDMPAVTDSDGHYTFQDSPPQRGVVTYQVSWGGDAGDPDGATAMQSVDITGLDPGVSISADRRIVRSGHRVHLTAHVAEQSSRHLKVFAKPYRRDRVAIASGDADAASGELTTTYDVRRRTTFIVRFPGDDRYEPAGDRVVVRARAVLAERLNGGYATKGRYRLYHAAGDPRLAVQLLPRLGDVCVYFRAQRYADGRWRKGPVSPCIRTNRHGQVVGELGGPHHLGVPYRLRAEWHGNRAALARHGRWLHVKFRR